MLQLVYISSASPGMKHSSIGEILSASRRNNAVGGITGLLIHDGRRFLQALEGDEAKVEDTFHRIRLDPRHRAVVVLSRRPVAERGFGNWAMAAQGVGPTARGGSIAAAVDALVAELPDANTRALFSSFARIDRKAA